MKRKFEKDATVAPVKVMICELMQSGHKATSLSEEYGIDASTIRKWKRQYDSREEAFTGSGNPSLTPEQKEIRELKKQLREAEMERDILKKAVGIFSASDRKRTGS